MAKLALVREKYKYYLKRFSLNYQTRTYLQQNAQPDFVKQQSIGVENALKKYALFAQNKTLQIQIMKCIEYTRESVNLGE